MGSARLEKVVFALNGRRYEVAGGDVHPGTTLLEFIRTRTPFTGTKLGCGEGGCGACVVLIATYNPTKDEVTEFSASSCLTLLYNMNLRSVTTTEGLGNTKDGFHSIQKRMSGFHASQCGFCTPGMCMSIFTSLANADKSKKPEPQKGFSKLTMSEAERAFSGNMCRCTGYRPIVDVCKSFASDVDLEDLGLNVFWNKGDKHAEISKLPAYTFGGGVCMFPDFLKSEIKSSLPHLNDDSDVMISGEGWYHPKSIEQYYDLLNSGIFSDCTVKVVVGNTSSGVKGYKDQDLYNKYIDIGDIPELSAVWKKDSGIEIGAATPISKTIEILEQESESCANGSVVFRKLAEHMSKVATPFVRNTASIGRNIVLAQKYPFPSDIATILLGAASTVHLQVYSETLEVTLEEFLEQPPVDPSTLLLSIFVPHWASDSQKESKVIFETYRAALRPLGNAVSYINSAMLGHVSPNESSGDLVLSNLHMAFGAYGTEHAIRATKVEQHLNGKVLTPSVVLEAVQLLRKTIIPMEGTSHPEYRVSVAVGFLFSFLSPFAKGIIGPGKTLSINSAVSSDTHDPFNLPLSSRQETVSSDEHKPVGEPIKKYAVELQASGEAVYVDDIPAPENCLYGEFIYSTQPLAYVKNIKFKPSLASEKVLTVVSAKDIPSGGQNIVSSFMFGDEPLFGAPVAEYAGQALGVVIAETQRYANLAGKQVVVEYDTKDLNPPILTVEQAVQHNSYFEVPCEKYPKQIGKFSKGMAEADHKIPPTEVKLASQYHFYMETQTALAIPDEDNTMVVYSSTQYPEVVQSVIARCLGIPFRNVRVITRRVGGGFGGKSFRSHTVATAAALCAFKLRRPVRIYLNYVVRCGSIVVEVGGVEIGQGLWTKVQQMTVFALGQLWPDGCEFLLDRVRVLQADTLNLIQGGLIAGSTSSESSCAATLQACNMLVDRLKPVMEKLKQQSGGAVSWDALIAQAVKDNVNLSSSAYWVPGQESSTYLNYGAGVSEVEIDLLTGPITLLQSDLVYDWKEFEPGSGLGPGSFIQGIGFFINEEHETNADGLVVSDSTWVYKIPSVDTIPKKFNAEVLNTRYHKNRVLSSKASGEPALVLAASVHCAVREAIRAARTEFGSLQLTFQLDVPAPMTLVKEMCGLDIVDKYLESLPEHQSRAAAA